MAFLLRPNLLIVLMKTASLGLLELPGTCKCQRECPPGPPVGDAGGNPHIPPLFFKKVVSLVTAHFL
jgi:hypothetical protein